MNPGSIELLVDLGILLAIGVLGWWLLKAAHPARLGLLGVALAYPAGAALLSWSVFVQSILGVPISLAAESIVWLVLVVLAALVAWRRHAGSAEDPHGPPGPRRHALAGWLAAAGVIVLLAITAHLSTERSYSTWDAIAIWGIKGFAIARQGTVFAAAVWGAHGLAYPLNLPLQIALLRLATPDLLPGSKLIFPVYYASLMLGAFAVIETRHGWKWAGLGSLLLAFTPILFEHASVGYANLPFTVYLCLGSVLMGRSFLLGRRQDAWLAGLLWAGAVWTRAEGLFLVPMIFMVLWLTSRGGGKRIGLSWYAVPFVLVAGSWQTVAGRSPATGSFLHAIPSAFRAWLHLDLHLSAIYWTFRFTGRQSIEPSVWGALLPVVVVLFLFWAGRSRLHHQESLPIFILAASAAVGVWNVGYFYVSSYTSSITYLLGTSDNRIFMPFWVLLLLAALFTFPARSEAVSGAQPGQPA